tara:strand:+ start:1263 stop:1637 length:375 start_codon:yes stop_codon:yes gene_type:complete
MELNMTTLIILTAALFLIGIFTQVLLNQNNLNFLLGNREGEVEESAMVGRTRRANNNLLESLPVFFTLAILSLILEVDIYNLAMYWLALRALYFLTYIFGLIYIRTLLWFGALVCLIMMGIALM